MLNYHKLNFFSVFLFLIWGITNAIAGPRDFLQAQQIAQQKAAALGANISSEGIQQAKAKVQEKVTAQRTPPYYIFNFADHAGYAIVGGDDRMPAIVGYSDRGTLNTDSIPENLKSFLVAYKATVEAVEKGDSSAVKNVEAAMKRVAGSYTPVAPLLGGIVWGQGTPFNDLCPKYDGVNTASTGSVATAMAQIMRYWKYPSSLLEDIPAYTSWYNIPIESIQKGIGYDWDNMLENYNNGYTPAQAIAVSTLMQHIGASVEMRYNSKSDAFRENVVPALTQYFGYDKNIIKYVERDNFEWEDWNKILQDELGKKRPIYYSGSSVNGAHAFVCDGMDADGYYHINWGWGGSSNDYFDISILNPNDRGIGASASNNGYSHYNIAVVGIVPNEAQDKQPSFVYDRFVVTNYKLTCSSTRQSASDSFSGTVSYTLTCIDKDFQATFTIGIKNEKGDVVPISSERQTLYAQKNKAQKINVAFDYALPIGANKIFAIQSTDNGKTWQTCYGTHPMCYVTDTELFTNQIVDFSDDDFNYQLDVLNLKACANSYIGNKVDVVVPEKVTYKDKKYVVTKVGVSCFTTANSSIVKTVKLSEGITDLGECDDSENESLFAMFCNTSLESIDLPKSLVTIGDGCFYACSNLQAINIPNDSHLEIVGRNCFSNCTKLENISFPKSLKEFRGELKNKAEYNGFIIITGGTFYQCSNLKTVTFDDECPIESFPMYCFCDCINLTTIKIPSSIKKVGISCFENCEKLESISFPKTLTELVGKTEEIKLTDTRSLFYGNTFYNCIGLKSVSFANDCSLEYIPSCCFWGCTNLEEIAIPEGVTIMGDGCLGYCSSLVSISLPNTIYKLGASCFKFCSYLKEIAIHEGISILGDECFTACSSLTNINLPKTIQKIGETCFSYCSNLSKIVIPEGLAKLEANSFFYCSSLTGIKLPSTLHELGFDCFAYCSNLKEIAIPEGVTEIPGGCFSNCSSLTCISLPNTILKLGGACFAYCSNLKEKIVIPEGVTEIPTSCFDNCSSLTSITLPKTIQTLGERSFQNCKNLTGEIIIPEGVTTIPDFCFLNCSSLTSINLPSTIRVLGRHCFYSCESWTGKVVIPEGVTIIPDWCFGSCSSLTSISLPSTIQMLGEDCFGSCEKWTGEVTIPKGVTIIPDWCFSGCKSLNKIILPNGIQKIGRYSFSACKSLTELILPNGIQEIGEHCFNCASLTSISIPNTVQKLGSCCLAATNHLKELRIDIKDVPENFADAINYGQFKEEFSDGSGYYMDVFSKNFLTLYVPASSVEAYKQAVGQYFKEILPLTETGINQANLDGMTISAKQGSIMISGLKDGTQVRLYAVDGKYVGESVASQGRVSFYCQEPMVIAKVGNKTLKIAVK